MLHVGFSRIDIIPPLGISMGGHPGIKKAAGVLDPLYTRAMVIENDEIITAFVSIDVLFVSNESVSNIKAAISSKSRMCRENIFISATHTHSGPLTTELFGYSNEIDYVKRLEELICESVCIASNNMTEAFVGFGKTNVKGISFNARFIMKNGSVETHPWKGSSDIVEPEGPVDEELNVIYATDANDRLLGALVNFANHPQIMERDNPKLSADFPGRIEKYVRKALRDEPVILFCNGACGNICPVNAQDVENIEVGEAWANRIGSIMAEKVLLAGKSADVKKELPICLKTRKVKLELRKVPEDKLLCAKAFLEEHEAQEYEPLAVSNYGIESPDSGFISLEDYLRTQAWREQEYRDISVLEKMRESSPTEEIEISAVAFGDNVVVALPFELFTELGLEIKSKSPYGNTLIIELTNGTSGYIPTREAFSRQGGYETLTLCSSRFVPETGELIVSQVIELLKEMSREGFA